MQYALVLNLCPHGVESISLDDSNGGGTRLTAAKCCGRWTVATEFPMSVAALREAAECFTNAENDMESTNEN